MIHAYQEMYLSNAQAILADAFDYVVNCCEIDGDTFVKMFIVSDICQRMEQGEPACLVGKSGIEIANEIVAEATGKMLHYEQPERMGRSCEYWCGWAIAYYQWFSGRKYSEIFRVIHFQDLQKMYAAMHEADITKFVDVIDREIREYYSDTNLKRIRMAYGCTQAELAEKSGVSLRSIQMYEQRNKDINKASVESIYKIAAVLGCSIEDLIER